MVKLDTETRQKQIIEVSLRLIKEGGIQNMTMKRIADEVGISEQAIYRHFDSKLELLTAIIRQFDKHFVSVFSKIKSIENSVQQITQYIDTHLIYFTQNPAAAAVIFSEEIFQNEETLVQEVKKLLEKRIQFVTELMQNGQNRGEIKTEYSADTLAVLTLGAMRILITSWRLSNFSFDLKSRSKSIIDDLIKMLQVK
ncbi:MAG: TetR/AcrR family transcriptional regulator [Calditrichaceae bacterium]